MDKADAPKLLRELQEAQAEIKLLRAQVSVNAELALESATQRDSLKTSLNNLKDAAKKVLSIIDKAYPDPICFSNHTFSPVGYLKEAIFEAEGK
jgi:hypothetical protein